ncbi:MAG: PQQ-binding-like beta-propeller repeat protein [Ilumatobacter sp.]
MRERTETLSTDAELIATLNISGLGQHSMRGHVTIGRDPRASGGVAIQIEDDPLISKSHCAIDVDRDRDDATGTDASDLIITDLGSSNGTYLHHRDGEISVPSDRWIPIPDGAEIEIGDQRIAIVRAIDPALTVGVDDDETPERLLRPTAPPDADLPGNTAATNRAAHVVEQSPIEPRPAASKRVSLRTLVPFVVAALAVGAVGFVLLRATGTNEVAQRQELPRAPTNPEQRWSAAVPGENATARVGESSVYVSSAQDENMRFTSFDRPNGEENWAVMVADADIAALVGEFDEVTVVQACSIESNTQCRVIAYDTISGDERWREPIGQGVALAIGEGVLVERNDVLLFWNPSTGEQLNRVRGSIVFSDPDVTLVRDRGTVGVYDDRLRPVFGPVDADPDALVTFDGSRVVQLIDGALEYVAENGDVTPGPLLSSPASQMVAVSETVLIVEHENDIVAYDVADDEANERWSANGELVVVHFIDGGTVVIVDDGDARRIVDVSSGDTRFSVEGRQTNGVEILPRSNLLLAASDVDEPDGSALLTGLDWRNGDEIWAQQVEGRFTVDEVLVVTGRGGDVTLFE